MLVCSGCVAVAQAIQAVAQVGTLYLTVKKEPVEIVTADCSGKIQPIYLSDGFETRLTDDELDQIDRQSVLLEQLCGPPAR